MIKISNLNKYFNKGKKNELHVLKDISYTFPDTGLVSILGESGSGKSTLINLVGGLLYHDEDIIIDGKTFNNKNISELEEYRNSNIGYIFQSYLVYKDLSVYENLKLSLNVLDIYDEEEINKRINYVLDILKLTKYKKKKASELSGGEQQRLSIARALIKKCKIYICDEPTGNLDTKNSINVMNILKKLSENALVILVTHNVGLAQTYSDTIIHMSDGKFIDKTLDTNTINVNSVNDIYLEDYKVSTLSNDNININFYNNDNHNVEIKLVYKDNKLYINSSNVEVISNVTFKEKRETFETQLGDFNYDNSNFIDIKSKDEPWYKLLFNNLRLKKNKTKKDRLLHICSIILSSIIMILMFMSIDTINNIKNASLNYDNYMIMNGYDDNSTSVERLDTIKELYDNKAITSVSSARGARIEFNYSIFPGKDIFFTSFQSMFQYEDSMELLYGDPTNSGIFLSYELVDEYEDKVKLSDLVGLPCMVAPSNGYITRTKIAGITKYGRSAYYSKGFFNSRADYSFNLFTIDEYKKTYGDFVIVDEMTEQECIDAKVIEKFYASESLGYKLGSSISPNVIVTGIIKDNPKIDKLVISNHKISFGDMIESLELYNDNIKIIEGMKPTGLFEVIIPKNKEKSIGDYIYIGNIKYKIVGLYDKLSYGNATMLTNIDTLFIDANDSLHSYYYQILDKEKHDEIITAKKMVVKSDYDIILENSMDISNVFTLIIYVIFIVLDILLMYIINRVTFYNNKDSFLIIRSISGNTNYIKKRYITSVLANNIKYLFIPMSILYLIYLYVFINNEIILLATTLFVGSFALLFISSLLINYLYINKQLKKEPLFLERKYDL